MKFTLAALTLASAASAASSFIPTGISTGCSAFLAELDADTTLQNCVKPLVSATAGFSPAELTASSADVKSTLDKVCSSTLGCDSVLTTKLSSFASACSTDLANADVLKLYDVLYIAKPLRDAVCSQDMASSTYCPIWIADNAKSSGNTQIAGLSLSASSLSQYALKYIVESASTLKRAVFDERAVTDVVRPNATTYLDTNLPFLFLQETTATTALCSSCASAIMIAYMSWETKAPYAAGGVGKSPTLANQFALYEAMTKQCPASFVATVNSSVTGQTNPTSGALSASPVPAFAAVVVGALATVFLI